MSLILDWLKFHNKLSQLYIKFHGLYLNLFQSLDAAAEKILKLIGTMKDKG